MLILIVSWKVDCTSGTLVWLCNRQDDGHKEILNIFLQKFQLIGSLSFDMLHSYGA